MRTFHTGGVAGVDITTGIPRVEELLEARAPKPGQTAILSEIDGVVEVAQTPEGRRIRVVGVDIAGGEGRGTTLAPAGLSEKAAQEEYRALDVAQHSTDGEHGDAPESLAVASGNGHGELSEIPDAREYLAPPAARVLVKAGARVRAGQELTAGLKNPHDILRIQGREAVQQYIIEEVQKVYRSQGVSINDKHIEIIVRQMLRKVRVDHPGDTEFLPGYLVNRTTLLEANKKVLAEGGEPARGPEVLLGITRASLSTDSFLAQASFQETTRVLTQAAVYGERDHLLGLKENVIIGRLVPARLDLDPEGRKRLGLKEEPEALPAPPKPEEALAV
jgi:DNA-directed RNA polymerase subunit beta'